MNLSFDIHIEGEEIPLDIRYEDEDLLVVNKKSGMVVHPAPGNYSGTLVNALIGRGSAKGGESFRPGIVHRLDKDTSGLMLVAKDDKCHELLAEDFKNKKIHREYIALIDGVFPQERAIIDAPIGRSKDNFLKMAVDKDGKRAVTHLEVIKKYKEYTLARLILETGRTHQIRVHLSSIGYPIYNDPLYGNKKCSEFGQFLHSEVLKFTHPITKQNLEFKVEPPKEFREFLKALDEND